MANRTRGAFLDDRGRRAWVAACALAIGLALPSCVEAPNDPRPDPPDLSAPIDVGGRFVVVDRSTGDLYAMSDDGGQLDVRIESLNADVEVLLPGADGALHVLTSSPAEYVRLAPETLEPTRYALPSGYDRLLVRDDGRFVVATYAAGSSGTSDRVLINPNQLSIVDLSAPQERALRTFALEGPRPLDFVFAPTLTLTDPSAPIELMAVLSDGVVSLVDLETDDLDDRQRRIPLTNPASGATVRPTQVQFTDDDPADPFDLTMFVTAQGQVDLFAIDLLPADPSTGRTLQPAINQIAIGSPVEQMVPFVLGGEEKRLVMSSTGNAVVIVDVAAGTGTRVALERSPTRAIVWEQTFDGEVRPQALMYRPGDSIVFFVDLTTFERQGMGAVRALQLANAPSVITTTGEGTTLQAVVSYDGSVGYEIIDLTTRTLIPIPATVSLAPFDISGTTLFAVTGSVPRLLGIELRTQQPFEVDMQRAGTRVVVSEAGGLVLVDHGDAFGSYSFFALSAVADGPIYELSGLVWNDLLARIEGGAR